MGHQVNSNIKARLLKLNLHLDLQSNLWWKLLSRWEVWDLKELWRICLILNRSRLYSTICTRGLRAESVLKAWCMVAIRVNLKRRLKYPNCLRPQDWIKIRRYSILSWEETHSHRRLLRDQRLGSRDLLLHSLFNNSCQQMINLNWSSDY